ncbi:hypothetical protein BX661DRAFT_62972 [Kickxella alabastrina]|uniref:uncharacterized protein n=1 Tax=Kickxella alabastrina TaxID=61397 RepID=UPI00221F15E0|nr:uncharacterized protein BX661DRAFT_62972 [Kickxella alabastrina]KAI7821636.1 hypothetical protein BX661DRAFT_62972 [Kickxella alabastrina]
MPLTKIKHTADSYKCTTCTQTFSTKGLYRHHSRKHNPVMVTAANGSKHKLHWKDDKLECLCGYVTGHKHMIINHVPMCKMLDSVGTLGQAQMVSYITIFKNIQKYTNNFLANIIFTYLFVYSHLHQSLHLNF